MKLLYLHGSTLGSFWKTGKVRYLDALTAGGMLASVHMVNLEPEVGHDEERTVDGVCFTAVGLARHGRALFAKARTLAHAVGVLCAGERADLVLADDANLLGLTARWIAARWRVPYAICIYYDNDLHHVLTGRPALAFLRSRRLECWLERWLLRGAAGVYAGNRGYRDYALRHGADPALTYLGSWSVDDVFYAAPPPPHPDAREILFVGRLHPLKFIDDLFAAFARLPPSLRLDVAGEGPDRARLEALVASQGLVARVRLLGVVPREELLARMQGARVLVATQGFSAVVEALLSGRPVVAYDHECNAEVVREGETGLLVPFRDVNGLAKAIERALGDPALARELGRRARHSMLAECALSRSIDHRRRFFERCLAR